MTALLDLITEFEIFKSIPIPSETDPDGEEGDLAFGTDPEGLEGEEGDLEGLDDLGLGDELGDEDEEACPCTCDDEEDEEEEGDLEGSDELDFDFDDEELDAPLHSPEDGEEEDEFKFVG